MNEIVFNATTNITKLKPIVSEVKYRIFVFKSAIENAVCEIAAMICMPQYLSWCYVSSSVCI